MALASDGVRAAVGAAWLEATPEDGAVGSAAFDSGGWRVEFHEFGRWVGGLGIGRLRRNSGGDLFDFTEREFERRGTQHDLDAHGGLRGAPHMCRS